MARERPAASYVTKAALSCFDGDRPTGDGPLLKREEAAALRRSAPLTHARLTEIFRRHVQRSAPERDGRDTFLAAGEDAVW